MGSRLAKKSALVHDCEAEKWSWNYCLTSSNMHVKSEQWMQGGSMKYEKRREFYLDTLRYKNAACLSLSLSLSVASCILAPKVMSGPYRKRSTAQHWGAFRCHIPMHKDNFCCEKRGHKLRQKIVWRRKWGGPFAWHNRRLMLLRFPWRSYYYMHELLVNIGCGPTFSAFCTRINHLSGLFSLSLSSNFSSVQKRETKNVKNSNLPWPAHKYPARQEKYCRHSRNILRACHFPVKYVLHVRGGPYVSMRATITVSGFDKKRVLRQ